MAKQTVFVPGDTSSLKFYRDAQGNLVIDAVMVDDELTVVHPQSGEERFLITDGEVTDLRPHKHEWAIGNSYCTVCHKSQQQINEEQDEPTYSTTI